ncbi:MAG: glutamine--fructose-6-phosphate transaminase (isomerizing) [Candidatus Verstraetearchaeota archaeon]|nr:glutamine--fructose-6-phosphate transaminase (isomerizing) [Candidatus Verstraetearchaeota archaeon]
MCGIFGCTSLREGVSRIIYDSLKKLEYRGYDSVGLATTYGGHIFVKKDQGRIEEVEGKLEISKLPGRCGIGHTRWATHGAPSKENAHPLTDCEGRIAVVHNGIIENYLELREKLASAGHKLRSRTDSEVIAHLAEEFLSRGLTIEEAVRHAALSLRGSYAFALISALHDDAIVCVRMESPLVIGISRDFVCCSSDVPALPPDVESVVIMNDGELAILTPQAVTIRDLGSGQQLPLKLLNKESIGGLVDKGGFAHYMIKEIREQPQVALNVISAPRAFILRLANELVKSDRVYLVGCGTSYHACIFGSYLLRLMADIDAHPVVASEFHDSCTRITPSTAVLAISQSGETADVLQVLRALQDKDVKLLALTNVMGSSITRLASLYVGLYAGPEMGVAATKTFIAQLLMLTRISIEAARIEGVNHDLTSSAERFLKSSAPLIEKAILVNELQTKDVAIDLASKTNAFFLARGINIVTALEGALKLKEISYIHAEGYPAGESKHGPIALVEEGYPCVFVCPRDETYNKIIGNIMEMKARGAFVVSCVEEGDKDVKEISDRTFVLPEIEPKQLTPVLHVIPLQLLAYYAALARGCDPDRPRNLAKSVTVT